MYLFFGDIILWHFLLHKGQTHLFCRHVSMAINATLPYFVNIKGDDSILKSHGQQNKFLSLTFSGVESLQHLLPGVERS